MKTQSDPDTREKVLSLIKDISVAQMVTIVDGGQLRARPMVAQQRDASAELWFFTSAQSGKIVAIEQSSEVLLCYCDPRSQTYVNVRGRAEVVRDRAKVHELWSEPVRVWFPKGADDPDLALIRVQIEEADYWDAPSSTFVHAYGYVKAVMTGERPSAGDVKHVELDGKY